jgi:holin-like protein
MVHAILALLVCQLLGEVIVRAAGIPIPGPVVGTLLMLAALAALREVPGELNSVAGVLLSHLSLLFVPAGVGVMLHVARIKAEWLPLLVGLLVSTALTLAVTAVVFFWVMRKMGLQEAEQNP